MTDITIVATRDVTVVNAESTTKLLAGQSITVPPSVAASLLGSGNFSRAETSAEDKEKKKKRGE